MLKPLSGAVWPLQSLFGEIIVGLCRAAADRSACHAAGHCATADRLHNQVAQPSTATIAASARTRKGAAPASQDRRPFPAPIPTEASIPFPKGRLCPRRGRPSLTSSAVLAFPTFGIMNHESSYPTIDNTGLFIVDSAEVPQRVRPDLEPPERLFTPTLQALAGLQFLYTTQPKPRRSPSSRERLRMIGGRAALRAESLSGRLWPYLRLLLEHDDLAGPAGMRAQVRYSLRPVLE